MTHIAAEDVLGSDSMTAPLRVGQVRDVATGAERRNGIRRPVLVYRLYHQPPHEPHGAEVSRPDGSRPRAKNPRDLASCPIMALTLEEYRQKQAEERLRRYRTAFCRGKRAGAAHDGLPCVTCGARMEDIVLEDYP